MVAEVALGPVITKVSGVRPFILHRSVAWFLYNFLARVELVCLFEEGAHANARLIPIENRKEIKNSRALRHAHLFLEILTG